MKWVFLTVLVIVAGAVAAFGIYTWGWHDRDSGSGSADEPALADEQALAQTYAREVIGYCDPRCIFDDLHRAAPGIWEFNLVDNGVSHCYAMHLDDFHPNSNAPPSGLSQIACK